jgi:ribonuclease T2
MVPANRRAAGMKNSSAALIFSAFLAAILAIVTVATDAGAQSFSRDTGKRRDVAGQFDFYVLSLSWSPTFCGAKGSDSRNDQQCGVTKPYRFIVHGLWPQYEKGFPDFCRSSEPDRVSNNIGRPMFDIMPSMGLIGHEWRKHGVCSGLPQKTYFDTIRAAYQKVQIPADLAAGTRDLTLSPDAIEQKFIASNPGMTSAGIATACQGPKLEEIRICMTKDLAFRDCPEVDRSGCKLGQIDVPPAK